MTEPHQGRIAMWFIALLTAVSAMLIATQFAQPSAASWFAAMTPIYAGGILVFAKRGLLSGVSMVIASQIIGSLGIAAISGRWDWAFYGWWQVANIFALCVSPILGAKLLKSSRAVDRRILVGGATAIVFFLLSNFSNWAFVPAESALYPKTLSGLMTCYYMGIPYLARTLVASVGWSLVLFSTPVLNAVTDREISPSNELAPTVS